MCRLRIVPDDLFALLSVYYFVLFCFFLSTVFNLLMLDVKLKSEASSGMLLKEESLNGTCSPVEIDFFSHKRNKTPKTCRNHSEFKESTVVSYRI